MTGRAPRSQAGAMVVELIVAVMLLATVIAGLTSASLYTSRLLVRSSTKLGASEFVHRELERLLTLPYDSLASGSRSSPDGTASWTVSDGGRYREILLLAHYTPAQTISAWDTVAAYRLRP